MIAKYNTLNKNNQSLNIKIDYQKNTKQYLSSYYQKSIQLATREKLQYLFNNLYNKSKLLLAFTEIKTGKITFIPNKIRGNQTYSYFNYINKIEPLDDVLKPLIKIDNFNNKTNAILLTFHSKKK